MSVHGAARRSRRSGWRSPAASCSDDAEPRGDARAGGSIVVAEAAAPGSLDPALVSTPVARRAAWLAYTPPLTYPPRRGRGGHRADPRRSARSCPRAPTTAAATASGCGRACATRTAWPLRASDFERAVARSLRLSPPGRALWGDIVGARAYAAGEGASTDVRGIAVDDRTGEVRIELENPDRLFPYALATLAAAPVPRGTPLRPLSARPPAGIGPYRVAQVRRGGDVVLERRRDWRLPGIPAGQPQEIVTRTIDDRAARVGAVIEGRADLLEGEAPVVAARGHPVPLQGAIRRASDAEHALRVDRREPRALPRRRRAARAQLRARRARPRPAPRRLHGARLQHAAPRGSRLQPARPLPVRGPRRRRGPRRGQPAGRGGGRALARASASRAGADAPRAARSRAISPRRCARSGCRRTSCAGRAPRSPSRRRARRSLIQPAT